MIRSEFDLYKDIIQEDFVDSYQNLTIKVMMSFKWISKYCNNSDFTLKIDDDVILNAFELLEYLNKFKVDGKLVSNSLMGYVNYYPIPIRNSSSKWYVALKDFNGEYYEDYCDGPAYVLSTPLAKRFYEYSLHFYFPPFSTLFEDIYIGNYL